MGILIGSSCLMNCLIDRSFHSSSSPWRPSSPPLVYAHRKATKKRKNLMALASLHGESSEGDSDSLRRRGILFVGVSVLPFLQLRAVALEDKQNVVKLKDNIPKQPEQDISAQVNQSFSEQTEQNILPKESEKPKEVNEQDVPGTPKKPETGVLEESKPVILSQEPSETEPAVREVSRWNPFTSFLNELGIIGSGVLGALYANSRKEKAAMESTIESMKVERNEQEAAMALMKEDFHARLRDQQEERKKQIKSLKQEEAALLNQLASANERIATLSKELEREKKLVEEFKAQRDNLEYAITKAEEDRKVLEVKLKEKTDAVDVLNDKVSLLSLEINEKEKSVGNLTLSLAKKESECRTLNSRMDQTKRDLSEASSIIEQLKEEISKINEELSVKISLVQDLNTKVNSLRAERDETNKKLRDLLNEFNDLKLSSEKRLVHDSMLLAKKDDQVQQLQEKVAHALREIQDNQSAVNALTTERDDLKAKLEKEANGREKLRNELHVAQRASAASEFEVSNLSKELDETKKSYADLNSKFSEMQYVFSETKKSLNADLEEANSAIKELTDNLLSIEEALRISKEELGAVSNELKNVMKDRESLKKELLGIYKKAEITAHELKEEKNLVATLNRELEVLGKQLVKDSEARKALESDLDEATKSLDEMNKSALLLSKELESSNSRASSLETEKEMLFQSLIEQKDITKEAQENLEDAQNLITRLGSDGENLEKRSKMLEDDLAAAKGEILRLRRQISSNKESRNSTNEHQGRNNEMPSTKKSTNDIPSSMPFSVKKTGGRRRKGDSTSDVDQ
ncbi:putative transcription factor bZIP family [Dioscorea sansibarensis]